MNIALFKKIINQVKAKTLYVNLHYQGEPFMNPLLTEMISFAKAAKMYVALSTNAHFLDDETLRALISCPPDKMIISYDGTTRDVYALYRRGGDLNKVNTAIGRLVEMRSKTSAKRPKILLQFLVLGTNEHQINEAKTVAKKLGIDGIYFKSAQVYDFENGSPFIPENPKFSRYRKTDSGKYEIKSRLNNYCKRLWLFSVITQEGDVLPCCFDKDACYTAGNLSRSSFKDIWKGDRLNAFRKRVLHERKSLDICCNCSEGLNL